MTDDRLLICVVDDDEPVRTMLCRKLEDAGFATVQAANGIEAVKIFKKFSVAVALIDIIMPDQEGLSTINEAKQLLPGMRILAISGGGRGGANQYLSCAAELGADDTLAKPFREAELISRVRRLAGLDQ